MQLMRIHRIVQHLCGSIADGFVFSRARSLWLRNQADYVLPMSKFDKLWVGLYLVLKDFSQGSFPPTHDDMETAFRNEELQFENRAGITLDRSAHSIRQVPYWLGADVIGHVEGFLRIFRQLVALEIKDNDRVLELGCGSGWMSEFLAACGCDVCGTSINQLEVDNARSRIVALAARDLGRRLRYEVARMETVDQDLGETCVYDFVFVHAALHHAFDWRKTFSSVQRILKPGGWFLICNEPNLLHTFVSYRVSKLDHTHEIGMSRVRLVSELESLGFIRVRPFRNRFDLPFRSIWLCAQKRP